MAAMPATTNGASTAEELREILEYERIEQFRDAVLAGNHPRVKIPAHLVGKQQNSMRNVSSPTTSTPRANNFAQPAHTIILEPASSYYNTSPNNQRTAGIGHVSISSKSEINPILLEKSDDLIKAEIQLQRQRLERSLRDQIEQQNVARKALLQTSESLPNFDLSEVLSKALAIVHPATTAEAEVSADPSVRPPSTASDSFDENTFYSSQHDSPAGSSSSGGQKEPVVMQSHSFLPGSERVGESSARGQAKDREVVMTGTSLSQDNILATQAPPQAQHLQQPLTMPPGLNAFGSSSGSGSNNAPVPSGPSSAETSRAGKVSIEFHLLYSQQVIEWTTANSNDLQNKHDEHLRQALENAAASPLVRAHNLSPFAPQPARVSPLATARDAPILRENATIDEAAPAQVSALRNQIGISSTDSSPRGVKDKEKERKRDKKKKRRKGKEIAASPESPYIKPEPRSPSPYGVAPLPRPQKRQRQSGQYAAELNYDEPRSQPDVIIQERPQYAEARPARAYERVEERYEPEIRRPDPVYRRVEREDEFRRVSEVPYARRPESPAFALPYTPTSSRPIRAASHAVIESRLEEPRYYREPVVRASVRPDADRERSRSPVMAPPRQAMRLMMDEYGRKFYEPVPLSSTRQSVVPPARYPESEIVYERTPVRTVSSRVPIPVETYEEDGILYRRPSPMSAPRRVVTQPEYAVPSPDYRSYRQREYSVRPTAMAPLGEEYVQVRTPVERRPVSQFEEAPREYTQRAPSVHPQPVRYEVPREYVSERMASVRPEAPPREYPASIRPEAPPREYAASVRPEVYRTMIPQGQREYSVRPMEAPRREVIPIADDGRYYEEAPRGRPVEVAYIERPRAREASVVVYADDVRREVYR